MPKFLVHIEYVISVFCYYILHCFITIINALGLMQQTVTVVAGGTGVHFKNHIHYLVISFNLEPDACKTVWLDCLFPDLSLFTETVK